jgi:squalene-associated FAD-dependent desaturase
MDRGAVRAALIHTHVIGGGLAGLSAAVALSEAQGGVPGGVPGAVTVYEAGPAAGGRCRSYFDRGLGCRIDNGNHLLLSGNTAAMAYLRTIGGLAAMGGPGLPLFAFFDAGSGEHWTIRPNRGRLPWWVLSPRRRVPGTTAWDYRALLALRAAGPTATVAEVLRPDSPLYRRLLEPLAVAALNTRPEVALAGLLGAVVEQTLGRGGQWCIPLFPTRGLSEALVDPAVAWLERRGGAVLAGRRIAGLRIQGGRVCALQTTDGAVELAAGDDVVLAVPPPVAADLLAGLVAPDAFEAIINVHFRVAAAPGETGFFGVIGGTAEWIFVKPGVVSVTISAANRLVDISAEAIAARVWPEVRACLGLAADMPPVRVVKERRATFAATAAQEARRPGPRTPLANLVLAGDWTATGLPATIEGAIRSGRAAANCLLATRPHIRPVR